MKIDVRKELGVVDVKKRLFIKPQPVDKFAAAQRLAITEKMFEQWHADINRTNTREMPKELADKYEQACEKLCEILLIERDIITEG